MPTYHILRTHYSSRFQDGNSPTPFPKTNKQTTQTNKQTNKQTQTHTNTFSKAWNNLKRLPHAALPSGGRPGRKLLATKDIITVRVRVVLYDVVSYKVYEYHKRSVDDYKLVMAG